MDEGVQIRRFFCIFVWTLALLKGSQGARVTHVEPHYGSLGGETRLTIFGSGFSADQFSQNDDPNTGNQVYLVGESGSEISCPVHKDGTTEDQIMCYTPERMVEEDHYVRVVVDGVAVPDVSLCGGDPKSNNCKYKPQAENTPTIDTLTPQSGKPGSFVTMEGKLISDRYGSNMDAASNGKLQKLLRVYVGPQDCGLKDGDNFYNLSLTSEESDTGTLKCKSKGKSVGFFNASFIIESPYGRSKPRSDLYRVSYNDQIYLFQTYTDITSISPSRGSRAGGLKLRINGNYFDNRAPYVAPKAFVGDTECVITNVVLDQYIECTVAADPQYTASKFAGNRGVNFEYWTSTTKSNLDDVLTLSSSSPGYVSSTLDETYHIDVNDTMDNYVSRMTTYFTPPHTGEYVWQLTGNDTAKLFVDGVAKVTSMGSMAESARMRLQNNTRYLLEVIHSESTGSSMVHLVAKFFNTKFTSAWTGKAEQEKQTIQIRSTVHFDIQELTFSGFVSRTHTQEVQTVTVETQGQFRFGIYGVYTTALTTQMDEKTISDAVNALPIFGSEESILLTRNPSATPTFSFTFVSKRGDFPPVHVVAVANSPCVSYTVTEDVKGAPDMDTMALAIEGTVSNPFSVSALSATTLNTAINSMFEARCPQVFESPATAKFYESYEESSDLFVGTAVKDTDPFCGKFSLKNPGRMYKRKSDDLGIMLSTNKMLCFAYKGLLQNIIGLKYSHNQASDGEKVSHWTNFPYTYKKDSNTSSETWYYTCLDMFALVQARYPSDTEHRVEEIWVSRENVESDIYIDSTFIGADVTIADNEINQLRLKAARPNGALINEATITSSGTNTYTVTLKPFDCGNQLPLIELANGRATTGVTASPSVGATLTLNNEGSGALVVTRSSFASPPVTGFIDVTYNSNTKSDLNVSLDAINFKKEMETLNGVGPVKVEKSGNCANYDLDVTFLTLPGDLPEMTVASGKLAGINPTASITTKVDGGLFYGPLTGDMLSTVHSQPQVRLYINDVPVACSADCSFTWDSAATPTVTAVSPTSGTSALSTTISITGTGFSPTASDNTVTIAGVACTVSAATSTSISCAVGNGPVGNHRVVVSVKDKGSAAHSSGDVMFEYTADVTGISPTTGSLGGGRLLNVTGYGFKSGATVSINSAACAVTSVQPDLIRCVIPASASSGAYDVVLQQGGVTLTFSSYTYDAGLTASVSTVSPASIGVQGDTLTISGSSFGSTQGTVTVGTKKVTVTSWSDTSVVVATGPIDPGSKAVKVETSDGLALTSSKVLPTVTVDLSITNVYPLQGSVQGGTKLTISGSGFGTNSSLVSATVGGVACDISSVSNSQIVCQIANAGRVHRVTNKGTDPDFGVYYAFDTPQLTVRRGDFVHWSWETPTFVKDVTHAIIEVDSPSSTTPKLGGFNSGAPSANGQYRYQFLETGMFYVWSGYVDTNGVKNYAGVINVVAETSSLGQVDVQVSGTHALHNIGGSSDPSDSSNCQSIVSAKSGCSDPRPTGGDATKFNFAFWTCSTPIISSIDQTNGTVQTRVTMSGEGLSTVNCQNEISFGDQACTATDSLDTSVTCSVAKVGTPAIGMLNPASVRVGNRGYSLITIPSMAARSFALLPNVEDIQPTSGSLGGGAVLTITGFGFGDSPAVTVGGYSCAIIFSSYTEVRCETPASTSQGERDIVVQAYVSGQPVTAKCETSVKMCRFTYAALWTPTVTGITPSVLHTNNTFTISGTKLGNITSDIVVTIGGHPATVTLANDTAVEATIENVPAGSSTVVLKLKDYGKASGSLTVTGTASISRVSPSSGSIHGDQLITVQGNGFVENQTSVTLDGAACDITAISLSQVTCRTAAHAAGSVSLAVTSNGVSYTPDTFTYDTASTPTITSVNPPAGLPGSTLTIVGSNLAGGSVTVTLDGVPCVAPSGSTSQVQCTLGNHGTGSVPVSMHVENLGASNTDIMFEYQLSLTSILPTQGGTAGGQRLTLTGTGFTSSATVSVCNEPCPRINSTSTKFVCKTPTVSAQTCDVAITVNGLTKTLSSSYTYSAGLTPTVTGVSPTRGGTGGGTTITVSGSGFGSNVGDVEVRIDGSLCAVSMVNGFQLQCVTGSHPGSKQAKVEVEVGGNGIAQESTAGAANFNYIDVWSSTYTWGGGSLPAAGEFIIIPKGMTLLLDTDTPRLDFLLIQGGQLIFDEKDVELNANIIMITDGGLLQVGTEAAPFQHKGIITLHGHHRSKELPIYGTKVLAVRNGTLDLHGIEVPLTWTRLASTAGAGTTTLTLVDPVEWKVGDEIVIAATGDHHSQSENEKKTITAISVDKMTLTLDSALEAEHAGTEETFDGTLVEFRAEVGLLTHNVVVRGNTDAQWEDEIKACEAGFNTGEFATQTCFQGRFGDEIGSSQFGGMILVHSPVKDTHEAEAKISYTEVTFGGQAFRLGRYPIHFHLNGDMSTSYVRGCGIHKTFNRAVNIHGTHNTIVEKTVIYNIMGGAFFLEDGIETGNTFQYNLAVFVRESSSLLNDDVTPASFWLTNPNNTVQHNAAAGGTHFGYWYRMHDHPDGPSYTTNVCCKKQPLGVFNNNSAHSFGWFGLWMFPDYYPVQGGCGGTVAEPAVFKGLFAWNNEKGAETVNGGSLQFEDCVFVQNKKAGYEGKLVIGVPLYTDDSPMVNNTLIVGKTSVIPSSVQGCTDGGVIFPYGNGFRLKGVRFVNFADSECAALRWTRIDGTCLLDCGGYTYHTEQITFVNAPNKAVYAWDWEGMVTDKDGSLLGKGSGWTLAATTGSLPSDCEAVADFSKGKPASACPAQYKFHRFSFNTPLPDSLLAKNFRITNRWGSSSVVYRFKRLSHPEGWMCAFVGGETYTITFENAAQIKNISFVGQFDHFEASDYVMLKLNVEKLPDRFSIDGGSSFINATMGGLDPTTAKNGDWEWDNANSDIKMIVSGRKRSRRSSPSPGTHAVDRPWTFTSYQCYYTDCIPPPDPNTVPPATERPLFYQTWNDVTLWNQTEDGFVSNVGGSYSVPQEFNDVKIVFGEWVVVTGTINKLGTLLLEGVLEFDDAPGANYEINANFIIIRGGRLIIGWPNNPFDGVANIVLRGNHSSPVYSAGDGPKIGSKAIGVFGGLDLIGKDVGVSWTQLATTATPGANQIVLKEPVTWSVGDDIVIGPTSYYAWETESFKISAIAADNMTLTLNATLRYKHIAHTETLSNGFVVDVAAPVGLLTRNIKVIGEDYSGLYTESFGARVIVGLVTYKGKTFGGYARLSNVEFYHTGQEGFTQEYDPRFSVAYIATGTVNHVKPSFVSKCAFHNGFNTAVGAFGIGSLNISDNVVFGSVGHAMRSSSNDTRFMHNLVALMVATASYQDRFESFNPHYEAGIEAITATNLILQDNLVSGSERMAYHVSTQECNDMSDSYRNNRAYSSLMGVVVLPDDVLPQSDCAKLSGFVAWKNWYYGIYYQNKLNVMFANNVLIENPDGIFPIVLEPSSLDHQFANKTIDVHNSTFVGATSTFDCTDKQVQDENAILSEKAMNVRMTSGGMIGLLFGGFHQAMNNAPQKPWKGIMAYNAIGGLTRISGNTFANYNSASCGKGDFAVATNAGNDDLQHPIEAQQSTLINVDSTSKIFYHRPNVGKINSADCVDMDCDALKKALFKDLDGTFLGHVGSVIPQSEYEWNGDPRRGLGDHRIPKEMLSDMNGNALDVNTLMPNKGVIRNINCSYQAAWQAYECQNDINYEMLVIESMDADTEVRRISPVAILGDGYVDLINGPQDHGWCSGYTCRLRLSTFHALVATGKEYTVYFSSLTPKNMRYRMLNMRSFDEAVKLSVWYSQPNRLDVYVDDQYVMATNGEMTAQGQYKLNMPTGNEFDPQLANTTGTNYFNKDTGLLSIIIRGSSKIDVITKETIIVSFSMPGLTVADFYGDNIAQNFASFLNIPLNKVRVVSVVSAASSSAGRKKRSSSGIVVQMEIGDEPTSSPNATASNPIDYNTLLSLAGDIVNECQAGNVSSSLNVSGGCDSVQVPSSNTGSEAITYATPTPHELIFAQTLVPEYEGVPLRTQPKIRVADIAGVMISALGTAEYPWQLTASIRSGSGSSSASLNGTLCVNSSQGWFNFTDLAISHMGSGYILDFNMTYPTTAANFYIASTAFDVAGRPVKIGVPSQTSGDIVRGARFSVTLDLRDENTNEIITDIAWRGHTWSAEASILGNPTYGSLSGILTSTFDAASGQAMFPDLNITGFGVFVVQFRVVSSPADFNLTLNHKLYIVNPAHVGMTIEEEDQIEVKFDVDFNKVLPDSDKQAEFEQMILSEYANVWPDVQLKLGSIREGSIVVTFTIAGTTTNVNSTAHGLCDSITSGTSYAFNGYTLTLSQYMTINNVTYYGVTCGSIASDDNDEGLRPYIIALIVVFSVLVLGSILVLIVRRFALKPKTKTYNRRQSAVLVTSKTGGSIYQGKSDEIEEVLFSERSFTSLKFHNSAMAPPMATDMSSCTSPPPQYNEYFKQPLTGPIVSAGSARTPRTPASTQHPTHISVSNLESDLQQTLSPANNQATLALNNQAPLAPPSRATQVKVSARRPLSPSTGAGNATPKLSRPLSSTFRESESPLPPVGEGYATEM